MMTYTVLSFVIYARSILAVMSIKDDSVQKVQVGPRGISLDETPNTRRGYAFIYKFQDNKINLTSLNGYERMLGFNTDPNFPAGRGDMEWDYTWFGEWLSQFEGPVYPIHGVISGKEKSKGRYASEIGFVFTEERDAILFKLTCPFELTTTVLTEENFE